MRGGGAGGAVRSNNALCWSKLQSHTPNSRLIAKKVKTRGQFDRDAWFLGHCQRSLSLPAERESQFGFYYSFGVSMFTLGAMDFHGNPLNRQRISVCFCGEGDLALALASGLEFEQKFC